MKKKQQQDQRPVMFRQGDVLVVAIAALPPRASEEKNGARVVLAYGEVTGHAHAIDAREVKSFTTEKPVRVHYWNAERFLQVATTARLVHEEHSTIEIPSGTYAVVQQREYHPEELRRVAD